MKLTGTKQSSTFGGRLLYTEEGESILFENGNKDDTGVEPPPSATPLSDLPASPMVGTRKRVKVRKRRSRIIPKLSDSDDEGLTGQYARPTSHLGKQQLTHSHKFKLGRSQRVWPMPVLSTSGRQSRAIAQHVHREFAWMDTPQGVQLLSIQPIQPALQSQPPHPPPQYVLPPQLSLFTGHHRPISTQDSALPSSIHHQMHAHHATARMQHSASTQQVVRDVEGDEVTEEGGTLLSGVDSVDGGVVKAKPGSYLSKSEGDLTCGIAGGNEEIKVKDGVDNNITEQPPIPEQPKSVKSEKHASHPATTDDDEGSNKGGMHSPPRDSEKTHREKDSGLSVQDMLQQVTDKGEENK